MEYHPFRWARRSCRREPNGTLSRWNCERAGNKWGSTFSSFMCPTQKKSSICFHVLQDSSSWSINGNPSVISNSIRFYRSYFEPRNSGGTWRWECALSIFFFLKIVQVYTQSRKLGSFYRNSPQWRWIHLRCVWAVPADPPKIRRKLRIISTFHRLHHP